MKQRLRYGLAGAVLGFLFLVPSVASAGHDCLYNVEWAPCWGGFRYSHIPSALPVEIPVSVPVPVYTPVYVPRFSPAAYHYPYGWSPYRYYRPWYGYGYPYGCFSCGGYGRGGLSYYGPSFGFSIGF